MSFKPSVFGFKFVKESWYIIMDFLRFVNGMSVIAISQSSCGLISLKVNFKKILLGQFTWFLTLDLYIFARFHGFGRNMAPHHISIRPSSKYWLLLFCLQCQLDLLSRFWQFHHIFLVLRFPQVIRWERSLVISKGNYPGDLRKRPWGDNSG